MHKNGNEKNRCRQGCQLASTGACGYLPFHGRSRCHQKLKCQNKYCVCKIQISCIQQKSWFSHEELDETHPNVFVMEETSIDKN